MSVKKITTKNTPLISAVIATYKCERTIEKCLLSIKKQTYPNIDIVVVDSLYYDKEDQERCKKIIKKYARYFQDGPERCNQRNRGIKEARGEYILVIDQDMYLTPKVIEDCYKNINNYVALIVPEISIGDGYWTKCVAFERYISTYLEEGMNESCRFFRKSDGLSIGGYDQGVVGTEDSDFHYRMKTLGKIGKIKNHLYHDEGRISFFGRVKKKYYYSKAFREYVKRYPTIAAGQFFPFKNSYLKHLDMFVKNPSLTLGVILLRSAEITAGIIGIILNRK